MDFAFTTEQSELQQRVRRLAEEQIAPIAEEADESPTVHAGLMAILANDGLFQYCVPKEYGGVGVRVMDLCIIREELARISVQADTNFIMQGLGSYPITLGGTEEQKAKYLPAIASGEAIAAFALTEPDSGSDVISMKETTGCNADQAAAVHASCKSWKKMNCKSWCSGLLPISATKPICGPSDGCMV